MPSSAAIIGSLKFEVYKRAHGSRLFMGCHSSREEAIKQATGIHELGATIEVVEIIAAVDPNGVLHSA